MTRSVLALVFLAILAINASVPGLGVSAARLQELGAESPDGEEDREEPLPLDGPRRLRYIADEISWMSIDVSPDGRTIAFDLLGDLYTMPIEGGEATRLTEGMAFDAQPRFSPDGRELVFTSDRNGGENLWIIDVESADARPVTEARSHRYQSPEWTPDGDYIVASRAGLRSGNHKLWMFHRDGGSGVELVSEPDDLKMIGPAFGPDPRYIWYSERTRDWQYNAIFPQYQLAVYDRDTGERYRRSSRFGSAFRPTLSPDGRWLAYGTRHDARTGLRLRDLENGEERWLAYPVQRDDQESRATMDVLPGMSFTPDSSELIVSYGGKLWALSVHHQSERQIHFTAEVDIGIGPELDFDYPVDDALRFTIRQIRDAAPSPDGSRLAFVALDHLYVMDFPDGESRRLTQAGPDSVEAQPAWSPDGEWIAFATWASDGGHLYRVRADGSSAPERLTGTPALYRQPAWSPDGERIAFVRDTAQVYRDDTGSGIPGATAELAWVSADGGEVTSIGPADGRERPHFARRDGRIYLYSEDEGLLSIRWDGTDERAYVKITGIKPPDAEEAPSADVALMSPDGRRALALVNNDLYVVTVPYVGGETPEISVADPEGAAFPVRRLTEIGGQFPAWSGDGSRVHWSIGNAHLVYDLEAAGRAEEAREAEAEARRDASGQSDGEEDTGEDEAPAYLPDEVRIAVEATRDIARGVAVLRGARLITMRGDEVIENGEILVHDNRIAAVGPAGTLDLPPDAEVIDVSGKTVVPGFVDTHAHMWPAWEIHKSQVWMYLANLAYGVTTTRDPQTSTTDVLTYADHVEAGHLTGPRIYSTGPGVFWNEQVQDLDHARRIMRRYSDYYDTKTIKMYVAGNRQQRQWILMAAREQGLMPTTEGSLDLKLNLTQFIDGYPGHEHSLPIFPLYGDVARLAAEAGTVYTPTLLVAYGGPWAENYFYTRENPHDDAKLARFTPHSELDERTRRRGQGTGPGPGGWFMDEEHVFRALAQFVRDLVAMGGRAGVGSHGQLQGLGYHWELWAMHSGGLSNHDALRVATIMGADAIGLDQDLGSLEAGKLADIVVLDANPLENIRNTNSVRYVMKNGRLYEGDSLDQIYPEKVPAGPFSWQDDLAPDQLPGIAP